MSIALSIERNPHRRRYGERNGDKREQQSSREQRQMRTGGHARTLGAGQARD